MTMKKILRVLVTTGLLLICLINFARERATFVHNTYAETKANEGNLQLKLIRIWGGEEEQDEQKFFEYPVNISVDTQGWVYISDLYNFRIQVFDASGKYLRTIGQKGRGPGDLVGPDSIDFSPSGDLWVAELGGRRIQCFDTSGKSKTIFRHNKIPSWMAVTSKNEIAVYCGFKTLSTKKIISFYNTKGKCLREIGTSHDPSKNMFTAENLLFAKDQRDNIYIANMDTPIVRKYSSDGKMIVAFTYETPDKIRPRISLNEKGDEIRLSGCRLMDAS